MQRGASDRRRKARIWKYLNLTQDDFYRIHEWPKWARDTALDRKSNNDRFQLFYFLVGNGLSPMVAGRWVRILDVDPAGIEVLDEREKALRHVDQMKMAVSDRRFLTGQKMVFNMHTRRPERT